MDLHHIEYFLQLKKYEHVSFTADFLNISQPALSKSIATLEAELGVKLFDRVGRHIKLNKNGEQFAKYAEQAIKLLNTGMMSAKNTCYETTGNIRITCYAYASILTPCISEYSQLNPFISFSFSQYQRYEDPTFSIHPDFILYASTEESLTEKREQFWVSQPLFKEKYCLIVSPLYRSFPPEQNSIHVHELKDASFITMLQRELFFNDITYSLCKNAGFFPKIYSQTDDFLIKLKLVSAGLGVAFIPESCLPDVFTYAPELRHFDLENSSSSKRTVFLQRHRKAMMSETALDFWDFVLDYFNLIEDILRF